MTYYMNLDRANWETFTELLGRDFEACVRSGSASQLARAFDEIGMDCSRKAFIIKGLGSRIARAGGRAVFDSETLSYDSPSPAITSSEYADAMALITSLAKAGEGVEGAAVRLAALDALDEAVKRGGHISDEAIDAVVFGLGDEAMIAQRCAAIIEDMAENWPYKEGEERKERLDDKALPALEKAASRLGEDKCAQGSVLDAIDTVNGITEEGYIMGQPDAPDYRRDAKAVDAIGKAKKVGWGMLEALERVEYGTNQFESGIPGRRHDTDTTYRNFLGDGKALKAPMLRAKLEPNAGERKPARLVA